MGSASSSLTAEEMDLLHQESGCNFKFNNQLHFNIVSKQSIRMLHKRFIELARHKDVARDEPFMTQQDFEGIPELFKNPLGSRLIEVFFVEAEFG